MRLLCLVQKAPGLAPNQRFRHEQWAPHLARDHDIRLEFEPFESPELTEVLYRPGHVPRKAALTLAAAARRWSRRHRARDFDGVVVLREAMLVGGALVERWLARAGIPLLYDFDDAIWIPSAAGANGVLSLARAPWKTAALCRLADAVTVGNAYLAGYASRFNRSVHVVRTSIAIERFPAMPAPPDAPFTVVWTGSHSTLAHLETIRSALDAVGARIPMRLRVVCDVAPAPFAHVALDFVPWRAASEATDLAVGHVGLMPLPDTPFTRGKCGCKALQYMAIGRPAVVAPVGMNTDIVQDGVNGRLAGTHDEWVAALLALAADPAARARMGAAARRTVLDGYTAESAARDFAAVAHSTLDRRAGRARPSPHASDRPCAASPAS